MSKGKIYPEERLQKIVQIIKKQQSVDVDSLTELFRVSGATIRADLRELEAKNFIKRTHGGAILKNNEEEVPKSEHDPSYGNRIHHNTALKEAIGLAAASIIDDGDSIMLDDGSTTFQVAKHLSDVKNVTVITNGLNICMELSERANANVIMAGGNLNKTDLSVHGKVAEEVTARYHANKAILGASGISLHHGITAPDDAKVELKKIMIKNSSEVILVADHTKFNRISLVPVSTLKEINIIITDAQCPIEIIDQLKKIGIKVILAK